MRTRQVIVALFVLIVVLLASACGGDEARRGSDAGAGRNRPMEEFGVVIDQSTPDAAAVSYVKLIDTCEPEAARRAFQLTVDPRAFEEEAIKGSKGYDETLSQAREQFEAHGLCGNPNQAPFAEVRAATYKTRPFWARQGASYEHRLRLPGR